MSTTAAAQGPGWSASPTRCPAKGAILDCLLEASSINFWQNEGAYSLAMLVRALTFPRSSRVLPRRTWCTCPPAHRVVSSSR